MRAAVPSGLDRASKLSEEAVAGRLHKSPVMPGQRRVDNLTPELPNPGRRALLVALHHRAEASDIGGEDRGEAARGHSGSPAFLRLSSKAAFALASRYTTNPALVTVEVG